MTYTMFVSRVTPSFTLLLVVSLSFLGSCTLSAAGTLRFAVDGHTVGLSISRKGTIPACSETDVRIPDRNALPPVEKQDSVLDSLVQKTRSNPNGTIAGDHFVLDTPINTSGKSLQIELRSSSPILVCELFENAAETTPAYRILLFPPVWSRGSSACSFTVPLNKLSAFGGFRVSAVNNETRLSILNTSVVPLLASFNLEKDNTILPAGGRLLESETSTLLDFSDMQRSRGQKVITLRYRNEEENAPPEQSAPEIDLQASDGTSDQSASTNYSLRIRKGTQSVYLYESSFDFTLRHLLINRETTKVKLVQISETPVDTESSLASIQGETGLRQWKQKAFIAPHPLPADLHVLLNYPQNAWRQNFMEVFSWNLFSHILVLDFVNLDVQDRFLKRLIYFTEKKGFRGTIQTNEVIDPLHGWNANDFSAESMASFYSEAERLDFDLNPEEILLRECLIQWGIIEKKGTGYAPLNGGLLTVARGPGMSAFNRTLLLQHECLHGVFFSRPDFRSAVETEMASMDEDARNFMISYFSFYQYDPTDHYLMVNEFQAYLLQQPLANLHSYITQNMVNTFGQYNPEEKRQFRAQAWEVSDSIYKSARRLSAELYRETGLVNGQLSCLVNR